MAAPDDARLILVFRPPKNSIITIPDSKYRFKYRPFIVDQLHLLPVISSFKSVALFHTRSIFNCHYIFLSPLLKWILIILLPIWEGSNRKGGNRKNPNTPNRKDLNLLSIGRKTPPFSIVYKRVCYQRQNLGAINLLSTVMCHRRLSICCCPRRQV